MVIGTTASPRWIAGWLVGWIVRGGIVSRGWMVGLLVAGTTVSRGCHGWLAKCSHGNACEPEKSQSFSGRVLNSEHPGQLMSYCL